MDEERKRDSVGEGISVRGVLLNCRAVVCLLFAMTARERREGAWRGMVRAAVATTASVESDKAAIVLEYDGSQI